MLLESLLGGLMNGCCVSYFLLRFFEIIPTKNPMLKTVILRYIVLIIVTSSVGIILNAEGPACSWQESYCVASPIRWNVKDHARTNQSASPMRDIDVCEYFSTAG